MWLVIMAALLPVVLLFLYIWRQDIRQPEPLKWLVKGLLYGVVSVVVALMLASPMAELEVFNSLSAWANAFLGAAIPEESAKLLMLWLLLRRNPYFDERLDGIVYACCIGLGFAGVENVMYLVQGAMAGNWVTTGIARAIFAVPGHFSFAILMGYFYAKAHFGSSLKRGINYFLAWLVPVIAHGVYDGLIMQQQVVDEWVAGVLFLVFLAGFVFLRRRSKKLIAQYQKEDAETVPVEEVES